MAMITCPECGKQCSDKAAVCPNCAFPISSLRTDGTVKIKFSIKVRSNTPILSGIPCKITDAQTGNELWKGTSSAIASFQVNKDTDIIISFDSKGRMFRFNDVRACVKASKSYQVAVDSNTSGGGTALLSGFTLGLVKQELALSLSEVDVIDSD
mgnify:FL=1